ncbi:bifunctional phosphopantothenoylcysteine decarboxylase/phosphopantothenate synthase [Sphingomonas sp. Leaf208]|jgi:phosphopantothenoylcysteine decarboxylase/phosphopantothenate--cysteine ligase|uniref:bifunctional phosphopantothenoylcysteine decarboxylase/phosphopantothenate--cysteine ligase CoaBC n=1 Tax=Sphingomonas sp. Leaf208 TaxID=1735679 RepID=UPI0006FBE46F|nr:bifunctional phosphopantothenoylcysteine decarboxylase/phosphopantothenate--cysteine ligase CoaBC [Sphingomonas sp. Leaf208]KQM51224.1 bifunctional phosphopantothenoylcysteine decarboxylase/phosphopantothenate synthase [Sphingomonas sp. Leaf208]
MKRILLIVGGGIAAYKAAELIRLLRTSGHAVRCVMTEAAHHFVTPMTLAALSEDKVYTTLWDLKDEAEMGHIQLSREADLIVVAPATADLMARMTAGLANDLATTLLLATDKPVLVAPAMNVRMWTHAATVRSVVQLRADGVTVMTPDEGIMACGEYGPGRLPEPPAIVAAVEAMLAPAPPKRLAGCHVLVTAGPTHEPIDPVRYIANRSSGKQGFAIAAALARLGARVTLVAGPVTLPTPQGVDRVDVETAREMADAVDRALPADAAVMVAAVADWHVESVPQKIKKGDATPTLTLAENPDIIATLARSPHRPRLLIGFAAETERVIEHAVAKRIRKTADWIVANDVSGDVMGGADNSVHLVTEAGVESWERLPKDAVAARLANRIADALEAVS